MTKNQIIRDIDEVLEELIFQTGVKSIWAREKMIAFKENVLEILREYYDTEACDRIKAELIRRKQTKALHQSISTLMKKS